MAIYEVTEIVDSLGIYTIEAPDGLDESQVIFELTRRLEAGEDVPFRHDFYDNRIFGPVKEVE